MRSLFLPILDYCKMVNGDVREEGMLLFVRANVYTNLPGELEMMIMMMMQQKSIWKIVQQRMWIV
jgi:hypothetical protein